MRSESIARNYAETLFALAERGGGAIAPGGGGAIAPGGGGAIAPPLQVVYGDLLDAVAHGIAAAPVAQSVLMSPRITKRQKMDLLARALPEAPREFVLFLQAVVRRGRQGLFGEMATEYLVLLDASLNRVRASVTMARPADPALRQAIAQRLAVLMGKEVIPHFSEDPAMLGGILVRAGDRVFDGSVRRRMTVLRRTLLAR